MNGFGDPEAIYGIERVVDIAAEKIGMDPVDFRLKNCIHYGCKAMEYEQVLSGPVEWGIVGPDMDSFPEIICRCAEVSRWKDKWRGWRMPLSVNGSKRRALAANSWK
jgi:CO/xanthine dehydrogenase Mo-binding subunit